MLLLLLLLLLLLVLQLFQRIPVAAPASTTLVGELPGWQTADEGPLKAQTRNSGSQAIDA